MKQQQQNQPNYFLTMAGIEEELRQTKQSLTELLDEVVYFEQQSNAATARGDGVARVLSSCNTSHVDAVEVLLEYARALSTGFIDEASAAHSNVLRVLRETSRSQADAATVLVDLGVGGCATGWTKGERTSGDSSLGDWDDEAILPSPRSMSGEMSGLHSGTVRMTRSGSVLAQTTPSSGYDGGGTGRSGTGGAIAGSYADLRINELVAALEDERRTSDELRDQVSRLASSSSSSPSLGGGGGGGGGGSSSPNRVHVTRRGSVEIQVAPGRHGNDNHHNSASSETVEALRYRIRELEIEVADERVRASAADRERGGAIRDRHAALQDLERAERERESSMQTAKSSDRESDAARESLRRVEREVDLVQRGKVAAERELSNALVERDRAVTSSGKNMLCLFCPISFIFLIDLFDTYFCFFC